MECVDWMGTLRQASFRGVRFFVSSDDMEVGRRLVVHEFPNRDRPFIEDLGEKAITFSVDAYVASDSVIAQKNALIAACRRRGPGTLVLPTEGGQQVRCQSARRMHEKDRLGLIAFQLDFVEAGVGLSSVPIALLEVLTENAATAALQSIVDAFLLEYSIIREDDWVAEAAISSVELWAETLDVVRSEIRLTTEALGTIGQQVQVFHSNASALATDGADRVRLTQTSLGLASVQAMDGSLVNEAHSLVQSLRLGSIDEQVAFEGLQSLAEYGIDEVLPTAYGLSGARQNSNTEALGSMFRRIALIEMATAAAQADWSDRRSAVNARATVAELFEREMANSRGRTSVYSSLSEVRGKAAEAISNKLADLDPVVRVESSAVMPSIVWAYRLYGDAERATDLIDRNRVAHPSFMPTEFDADAPTDEAFAAAERRTILGV